MNTNTPSWAKVARRVLGKRAVENIGDGSGGPFALVTPCMDGEDFSLWATREAAEKWKAKLGRVGCCGGCWPGTHYVVDLAAHITHVSNDFLNPRSHSSDNQFCDGLKK